MLFSFFFGIGIIFGLLLIPINLFFWFKGVLACLKKFNSKYYQYIFFQEGWQSGQMQRTVTPSGKPYIGSNPIPSTTKKVNKII